MKTFAQTAVVWSSFMLLALAASKAVAPVQASMIVLQGNSGDEWWIIGNGTSYDLRHILHESATKTMNLDQMGNSTLPKIVAYLKKQGVELQQ